MVQPRIAGRATGISLLLPITLSTMAIVLLAPVLPLLLKHFHGVPGYEYWVPMVLTIPAFCVALISPVAGILGDNFGRRRLLIFSLIAYGVVGLAPVFLESLPSILISRVGVGIAEALITTLSTTMIADYFTGEARNKWLAGQAAVASLSATLFFIVGGQLGDFGWQAPFWVYGSAFLMLIGILVFTWPQNNPADAPTTEKQELGSAGWSDFPWKRMFGILAVTVFSSVFFYTIQIQTAPGLFEHGLKSPGTVGLYTAVASLGVPLGTIIYSRVSKAPVYKLLASEFALLGIGFIVMSFGRTPIEYLLGGGLNQVAAGLLLPTLLVWAMDGLPFALRARGTGLWTAAFSLGQWLSPIATTTISLQVGGLLPAFQYLGYVSLVAMVSLLLFSFSRANARDAVCA
jgi:MFS family permease